MNISKNKGAITLNNNLKPKEDKLTQLNQPGIHKIILNAHFIPEHPITLSYSSKYVPNAIYFFYPLFSKSSMIMEPYKKALYQRKEIEYSTTVK